MGVERGYGVFHEDKIVGSNNDTVVSIEHSILRFSCRACVHLKTIYETDSLGLCRKSGW